MDSDSDLCFPFFFFAGSIREKPRAHLLDLRRRAPRGRHLDHVVAKVVGAVRLAAHAAVAAEEAAAARADAHILHHLGGPRHLILSALEAERRFSSARRRRSAAWP